jgi:hypothetical protein
LTDRHLLFSCNTQGSGRKHTKKPAESGRRNAAAARRRGLAQRALGSARLERGFAEVPGTGGFPERKPQVKSGLLTVKDGLT